MLSLGKGANASCGGSTGTPRQQVSMTQDIGHSAPGAHLRATSSGRDAANPGHPRRCFRWEEPSNASCVNSNHWYARRNRARSLVAPQTSMARYLEASSGRDAGVLPHPGHPSPMLSLEGVPFPTPSLYWRAGTLGKAPQSVAMVDGECRLALAALQKAMAAFPNKSHRTMARCL
jgi:hypothetical protein